MTQFVAPVAGANTPRAWQNLKADDSWLIPFDTGSNLGGVLTDDGGGYLSGVSQNGVTIDWQVYSDEACTQALPGTHSAPTGHQAGKSMQFTFTTDQAEIDKERKQFGQPFSSLLKLNTRYYMLVKPFPGSLSGEAVAVISRDYNQPKGPR